MGEKAKLEIQLKNKSSTVYSNNENNNNKTRAPQSAKCYSYGNNYGHNY